MVATTSFVSLVTDMTWRLEMLKLICHFFSHFFQGVKVPFESGGVDCIVNSGVQDFVISEESDFSFSVVTEVVDVHKEERKAQDWSLSDVLQILLLLVVLLHVLLLLCINEVLRLKSYGAFRGKAVGWGA